MMRRLVFLDVMPSLGMVATDGRHNTEKQREAEKEIHPSR